MKALLDKKLWEAHSLVAGIDEAGRGPLAGPVVAAAVVLPRNFYHPEVNDSKLLSRKKRIVLFKHITEQALGYGYGIVNHDVIDKINILNATKKAMSIALTELSVVPELVLVDAVTLKDLTCKHYSLIKGDTFSISIAAASILAKIKRDEIMCQYHKQYPMYGFNRHMGYPTKYHREQIRTHGPCPIHRLSFRLT